MLGSFFTPEQIQFLVDTGVIDVFKRCSMDGCRDIGYAMGPLAQDYAAIAVVGGLAVAGVALLYSYSSIQKKSATSDAAAAQAAADHSLFDTISPINFVSRFTSKPSNS